MDDVRRRGVPKTAEERAASHFGVPVEQVSPQMINELPEQGISRGILSETEINQIAEAVAEKVKDQLMPENELMLHSMPYAYGSPGIVVDEAKAKSSPCKCVEYKLGKKLCWSSGIIGALTNEQEALYCPTTLEIDRPGTVRRMEKWQEAVDTCKAELTLIPEERGEERMTTWMRCMSRELKARGIET